jgi:hypothetical protein
MDIWMLHQRLTARGFRPTQIYDAETMEFASWCPCCQETKPYRIYPKNLRASRYRGGIWLRCLDGCDKNRIYTLLSFGGRDGEWHIKFGVRCMRTTACHDAREAVRPKPTAFEEWWWRHGG